MSHNPLRLSVKAKNWRMNDKGAEEADAEFHLVRKKALERDKYTCVLCGFKSARWQEVHHKNDDHTDNSLENLMTVCSYCHMCQHIGLAGSNEEASLIWLPEISQAQLHHIVRAIQIARAWAQQSSGSPSLRGDQLRLANKTAQGADQLMGALREREDAAEDRLGTSDLVEISNVMLAMNDEQYERRDEFLQGFRMLPYGVRTSNGEDQMSKMVTTWMEPGGPYVSLKPKSWLGIFKTELSKLSK